MGQVISFNRQEALPLLENKRVTSACELADIVDGWMRTGRVSPAQAKEFRKVMTAKVRTLNLVK